MYDINGIILSSSINIYYRDWRYISIQINTRRSSTNSSCLLMHMNYKTANDNSEDAADDRSKKKHPTNTKRFIIIIVVMNVKETLMLTRFKCFFLIINYYSWRLVRSKNRTTKFFRRRFNNNKVHFCM